MTSEYGHLAAAAFGVLFALLISWASRRWYERREDAAADERQEDFRRSLWEHRLEYRRAHIRHVQEGRETDPLCLLCTIWTAVRQDHTKG